MQKLIFDIETTGADIMKDRIVQLAIKVIDEEGNVLVNKSKLYKPDMKTSDAASVIHGITNEKVKLAPLFKDDAKKLKKMFEDKIIITYNGMRFDIPLLMNEFDRAGVEVNLSGQFVDVLKVERKLSPHTLSATYKKYTGNDLKGAHDANADVDATDVVMQHQMERNTMNIDDMMEMTDTEGMADYYGKLKYDSEGFLVFNFGKERNNRVVDRPDYCSWILGNKEFPSQVRKMIQKEQTKTIQDRQAAQKEKVKKAQAKFTSQPGASNGFQPLFGEIEGIDDLPF